MSVRQTSIDVYRQILEEGLLSAMRRDTYQALFDCGGPSTAAEVASRMRRMGVPNGGGRGGPGNAHARLNELVAQGVVYEVRVRKCSITERDVTEYELTGNLPRRIQVTAAEKRQKLLARKAYHEAQLAKINEALAVTI